MNEKARNRHRRGLASFFAVAALGLIATAVLAMTVMLKIDHRRTQASAVNAQLRQLLLAGADEAQRSLETVGDSGPTGELALPAGLAQSNASVRWHPAEAESIGGPEAGRWITVIAEYGTNPGVSAYQRVCFVPDENRGGYRIASTRISPQ